jgi:hypothetical protein
MKDAFYSPQAVLEEKKEKEVQDIEEEKRKLYFERLRKDKNFQKYVVGLIRNNIVALTDGRLLDPTKFQKKEEFADLVVMNIKASKVLENILSDLL